MWVGVLTVVFWFLVTICAVIGLVVVGLVLVAQTMPRESTGTFLAPEPPPDDK